MLISSMNNHTIFYFAFLEPWLTNKILAYNINVPLYSSGTNPNPFVGGTKPLFPFAKGPKKRRVEMVVLLYRKMVLLRVRLLLLQADPLRG
jgi:hypothetical protein